MRAHQLLRIGTSLGIVLIASVLCAVDSHAQVKIELPAVNAVVIGSSIPVSGTLVARTRNVGVTVNDVAARLDLEHAGTKSDPFRWYAEVDAPAGRVKLKARSHSSTTGNGADEGGASTVHVHFQPSPKVVALTPSPASGVAPLDVTLAVRTDPADEITHFALDFQGDGSWDVTGESLPEEDSVFRFATPGIWFPVVRVTMRSGAVVTATSPIHVQSFGTVNAIVKEVWNGFGQSLSKRDINGSLNWLASDGVRDKYRSRLTLIRDSLPQFAGGIRTIHPVWILDETAHYLMTRTENGRLKGYHVYFARDASGLWKIVQF